MKRNRRNLISKMTGISVLAALATVLMLFGAIQYPPAPWLKLDFSDTVVMLSYVLYGFWGAFAVGVIKAFFSLIYQGLPTMGIGEAAALITSLLYIFGLYFFSHIADLFKKGLGFRIIAYALIGLVVSVGMTLLNALFITPSYISVFSGLGGWSTVFNPFVVSYAEQSYASFGTSYFIIMVVMYLPFNLLKAVMVEGSYEILFNRLVFVFLRQNPTARRYFIGSGKEKDEPEKADSRKASGSDTGKGSIR